MKKRVILVAGFGILAALSVTFVSQSVDAVVPGSNTYANYDSTGSAASSGGAMRARISEDGKTVAWTSTKHDYIANDPYATSSSPVIYQRNLQTGVTNYVTVDTAGAPVPVTVTNFAMSRTGRYVAYMSKATSIVSSPSVSTGTGYNHIYLKDMQQGTTRLVDQSLSGTVGNGDATSNYGLSVSDDGRFVLFASIAKNLLVSGNPSSGTHFYVKDMETGQVINPTVSASGQRANASVTRMVASCDGSIMAFGSASTNLTPEDNGNGNVYVVDVRNGYSIKNITHQANQASGIMSISCNGRYLIIPTTATNLTSDAVTGSNVHYYRYDRLTGDFVLVDKSSSGYIASYYVPISGTTFGNGNLVSDDGKVIFMHRDHNMISPAAVNDDEVYMRNPEMNTTELVPVNASGTEQNSVMTSPQTLEISARGNAVMYNTTSTNLLPVTVTGLKLILSSVE